MRSFFLLLLILESSILLAQSAIDTSFSFQTDPNKKVSIYIPSNYSAAIKFPLMVGLHPFNTSRWNAKSWRDTLIHFAENNNLILLCPDGGTDGQVDDPIDTEFTTAMIDSIQNWYNIDSNRIYCMGFSWGGKTTYTYGLTKPNIFCGYFPYGAAVNVREVSPFGDSIKNKPIYILHGANDFPSSRFTPLRDLMVNKGGIVRSKLLPGVGHSIDFNGRNQEFTIAYKYLDSVCTHEPSTFINEISINEKVIIFPNPAKPYIPVSFTFQEKATFTAFEVYTISGALIREGEMDSPTFELVFSRKGMYHILLKGENESSIIRLVVH